jgi:hypothetical protein
MFDWQSVVVTIIALGAVGIVVRRLLPARKVKAKGADAAPVPASASVACSHCAAGESHPQPHTQNQNRNPNAMRNVRPPSFPPGAHAG